jgi:hypothetical protein
LGGREVPPSRYISPHLPQISILLSKNQKKKKGRRGREKGEERKRGEEAAKPY